MAVDPGRRCLKVLVVEAWWGRPVVKQHLLVDIQEEGLFSAEEVRDHLRKEVPELLNWPVALAMPQDQAISQILDLPKVAPEEVHRLVESETVQLSGLSERSIIYDYVPLPDVGRFQNPYWITLCQEEQVVEQIHRLGLNDEQAAEVSASANGLITAYQAMEKDPGNAVLVDLGASSTMVALLVNGQRVYATSYAVGGDQFSEAIATQRDCGLEAAEEWKCTRNLFEGEDALPSFWPMVDHWFHHMRRILSEWLADHPREKLEESSFRWMLLGGGASQKGLLKYLCNRTGLSVDHWVVPVDPRDRVTTDRYAVVYGIALEAILKGPDSTSLLPAAFREARRRRQRLEKFHFLNFLLVVAVAVLLGVGTWNKLKLLDRKSQLLNQAQGALQTMENSADAVGQMAREYAQVQPILEQRARTMNLLTTLSGLYELRGKHDFWMVLFADDISYANAEPLKVANTGKEGTNAPAEPAARTEGSSIAAGAGAATTSSLSATNRAAFSFPRRGGYILELCIPSQGEAMRKALNQIVSELKQHPHLKNVDSLPAERRRQLVNPAVLLPEKHFSLLIEPSQKEFVWNPSMGSEAIGHDPVSGGRRDQEGRRLPWQQPETDR